MRRIFLGKKWHERMTKFCAAILFGIGAFLIGLAGVLGMPEAAMAAELTQEALTSILNAGKAAQGSETISDSGKEAIQIAEFGVVQGEEGIYGRCVYRNFDGSGGMMQLYLERAQGQGEFLPVSYADLDLTAGETKAVRTIPQNPVPGIYRAVLVKRGGEGTPVVRFRNSSPYEVKDTGENSEEPWKGPEILDGMKKQGDPEENESCRHIPAEKVLREADPAHDAILARYCERCGQILECVEVPNSAYAAFLNETEEKIRSAPPDKLVVIETDRWVSFDEKVLKAIGDRQDLPILVRFRYQGEQQQTLIPPGTDIAGWADENGFCGFCRLADFLHS